MNKNIENNKKLNSVVKNINNEGYNCYSKLLNCDRLYQTLDLANEKREIFNKKLDELEDELNIERTSRNYSTYKVI